MSRDVALAPLALLWGLIWDFPIATRVIFWGLVGLNALIWPSKLGDFADQHARSRFEARYVEVHRALDAARVRGFYPAPGELERALTAPDRGHLPGGVMPLSPFADDGSRLRFEHARWPDVLPRAAAIVTGVPVPRHGPRLPGAWAYGTLLYDVDRTRRIYVLYGIGRVRGEPRAYFGCTNACLCGGPPAHPRHRESS